jgi:FMN-dependent NADH-azoreductase
MLMSAVEYEQTPYLDFILKFIGFTEISYVHVEGQSDPTQAQAKQEAAATAARALAATW